MNSCSAMRLYLRLTGHFDVKQTHQLEAFPACKRLVEQPCLLSSLHACSLSLWHCRRASHAKFTSQSELAAGLSGVSVSSETVPIKVGIAGFNSDGTPKASRASSYTAPGSILIQRGSDTPRASLLGGVVQPLNVEGSDSSLLSPGSSKKVCIATAQELSMHAAPSRRVAIASDEASLA